MQTSQSFIQIPNNPIRLLEYHCQSGITQVEFHDNYIVQGLSHIDCTGYTCI